MRSSDLAWFGLRVAPFSKEIGDDDLWMPTSKTELVDDLADAVEAHATVLLTGEPGVGKTCVLRALRRRLSPDGFRLTYCHNPRSSSKVLSPVAFLAGPCTPAV